MHIVQDSGRVRRVTAGIVAALLAVTLLDGCAASQQQGGNTTLTVWHYYSLDNQLALLKDYAAIFKKSHPDVTVVDVYVPHDSLNAKLAAAVGTKKGPDVIVFDGYSATSLADSGALAPMTSEWAKFAGADKVAAGAVTKVDKDVYAVQGYVNTLALYYNKDILDQLGVQPPTNMTELEADMKSTKAAGFQGITMAGQPNLQGAFQAIPWLTGSGFSYDNPKASALTKAFTTLRGWVTDGYLSPEVATWDQNVPFSTFAAGGVAFAENGNWQLSNLAATAKFKYGVVPLPAGTGSKVYLGGEAEAIGAFSKNPSLAFDYLSETFFSKSGQLAALKSVGSIPTRSDAAADSSISSDPYLSQFSIVIAKQGAPFPDLAIPAKNADTVYQDNGTAWSAALSGQQSPADAASALISQLKPLLSK